MKQNNCIQIGQYPKWLGKIIVWLLKKKLPKGVKFKLYGRGKGSSKKYNYGSKPLSYCSRVAIYIYFCDKALFDYAETKQEKWRYKTQLENLQKDYKTLEDLRKDKICLATENS